MVYYMYIDEYPFEFLEKPKVGTQYTIWYAGKSRENPKGIEFKDVINGREVHIRALDRSTLTEFRQRAFARTLPLRIVLKEEE